MFIISANFKDLGPVINVKSMEDSRDYRFSDTDFFDIISRLTGSNEINPISIETEDRSIIDLIELLSIKLTEDTYHSPETTIVTSYHPGDNAILIVNKKGNSLVYKDVNDAKKLRDELKSNPVLKDFAKLFNIENTLNPIVDLLDKSIIEYEEKQKNIVKPEVYDID